MYCNWLEHLYIHSCCLPEFHNRKQLGINAPFAPLVSNEAIRKHRSNWNNPASDGRGREKYAIRKMCCENRRTRPMEHVLTPLIRPLSIIDRRMAKIDLAPVQESKRDKQSKRGRREESKRVFLHYVRAVQADMVPRAQPTRLFRFPRGSAADKGHSYAGCS